MRKTGSLAVMLAAGAVLILSATSFAGTPSLGAGCGGGATIAGSDTAGKLTLGLNNTVCVLTFSTAFANAPACTAMNETNGGAHAVEAGVKSTTSTLTIDAAAPWADGDTIAYICQSY
jgi:hypothetical protein